MRSLPIIAVVAVSAGLAACTVNTAPPPPAVVSAPPSTIVTTPAPTYMAPSSPSVVVRP